jgi:aminopeptidase C
VIIDTARAGESLDSRVVAFLLDRPLDDGGQWDMFASLVRKYGLVPKYAMPETKSTQASLVMNRHLKRKLRFEAMKLRRAVLEEKKYVGASFAMSWCSLLFVVLFISRERERERENLRELSYSLNS